MSARPLATLAILALATTAAACRVVPASPDAAEHRTTTTGGISGDTMRLAIGETATIPGTPVAVTFVAVPVDQRCPTGSPIQCVWAGDAHVALRLAAGAERRDVILHTGLEPRRETIAGHVVELVDLAPPTRVNDSIPPREYRATLRVAAREAEPPIAGTLGDTVRIPVARTAAFDGGALRVTFVEKGADSRCPANAMCVHVGDAEARLLLEGGGTAVEGVAHTHAEPRAVSHAGYRVHLVGIDPYPGTEPPNARMMPVAVLVVTRGS